jgi:hypothetical protein
MMHTIELYMGTGQMDGAGRVELGENKFREKWNDLIARLLH